MQHTMAISGYVFSTEGQNNSHSYLLPAVLRLLDHEVARGAPRRVFDLGCGNGSISAAINARGFFVAGADPSTQGIEIARRKHPELDLRLASAYDDLASLFGRFPIVVSLEVVEHVYAPRAYAATLYSLVEKGGVAIVSTPYHSYLKNLAIAVTGGFDRHFTALWDHGHIKFWSMATLGRLLREAGFRDVTFLRVGRIAALAKSMIAVAKR